MAEHNSNGTQLAPNRSARVMFVTAAEPALVIPDPNTVPDPQAAIGIATANSVRCKPSK